MEESGLPLERGHLLELVATDSAEKIIVSRKDSDPEIEPEVKSKKKANTEKIVPDSIANN